MPMYTRRQVLLIKPEWLEGTDAFVDGTSGVQGALNTSVVATTGGSTTTLVLTTDPSNGKDDYYNNCIIDILVSANTHALRRITDYVAATKTITFTPLLGAAVVTGTHTILSNALLIRDLNFTPNSITEVRDYLRDTWSPLPDIITPQTSTVTFSTELKGYSLADTQSFDATATTGSFPFLPEINAALIGCKMSVTSAGSATRTVTYAPLTSDTGAFTVSLYVYKDGVLHKITGAVGDVTKIVWTAGMIAKIDFEFRGVFNSATTTPLPTINTLSVTPPAAKSASLIVGGSTYVVQEISSTLGNTLADRPSINKTSALEGVRITGRTPTGTFNPESVTTIADFWTKWEIGTLGALTAKIGGTTSHNKIGIDFAKIQYTNVGYGDRDGIMTHDIPFKCTGTNDDEWKIYGES